MTCNQIQEKLLHLIDKEIPSEIRRHLMECEGCERKNQALRATEESLKDFGNAVPVRRYLAMSRRRRFRQSGNAHFGTAFLVS